MSLGPGEVGHTWMIVDGVSGEVRSVYKQKDTLYTLILN